MGFLSNARKALQEFKPFPQSDIIKARKPAPYVAPPGVVQMNQELYGQYHNKQLIVDRGSASTYVKKGYISNADVYSIIDRAVTNAAAIPWQVVRMDDSGKPIPQPNSPLQKLLDNPNNYEGITQFKISAFGNKLLTGKTFIYGPRLESGVNSGQTLELHVLPAPLVKIVFGSPTQPIAGYTLKYNSGGVIPFKPQDVCYSKYWNPNIGELSDLDGLSPLAAAAKNLGISNELTTTYGNNLVNQGPPGILTRDGNEFTQQQRNRLNEEWQEISHNWRVRGVIPSTGAMVKWVQMGLSPHDLELLASDKWTFAKLCNVYRMPAGLFNTGTNDTYENQRQYRESAYTDCYLPLANGLLDDLNRWIAIAYDPTGRTYIRLDLSNVEVLQKDKKMLSDWVNACWFIPVDRKQELLGEKPDPQWKGVYMVPAGLIPVKVPTDLSVPSEGESEPPADVPEQVEREIAKMRQILKSGISDYL